MPRTAPLEAHRSHQSGPPYSGAIASGPRGAVAARPCAGHRQSAGCRPRRARISRRHSSSRWTTCAPSRGICVAGLVPEVRRRGNRHDGADRLDPVGVAMVIDELHHHTRSAVELRAAQNTPTPCATDLTLCAGQLARTSRIRTPSCAGVPRSSGRPAGARYRARIRACRNPRSVSVSAKCTPVFARNRLDRGPLGRVLSPVLADQPHRLALVLRGNTESRDMASILSRKKPSDKPRYGSVSRGPERGYHLVLHKLCRQGRTAVNATTFPRAKRLSCGG